MKNMSSNLVFLLEELIFHFSFADICSQKRDSGICPGNVPRFYFDKTLGRCQLFSYGGCGGNSNNFETLDQCVAHCGGTKEDIFQISTLTGELLKNASISGALFLTLL